MEVPKFVVHGPIRKAVFNISNKRKIENLFICQVKSFFKKSHL